jgi:hypothetical protein
MTNVRSFATPEDHLTFADEFIAGRVKGFSKDINACLTPLEDGKHAYMPGLMTCISFFDLLRALYEGNVRAHGAEGFAKIVQTLAPPGRYPDPLALKVLYVGFRHKLAHLGHPYFVMDTAREPQLSPPHMLLTWHISERPSHPPISIERHELRPVTLAAVPWPMHYDSRIHVSIRSLANDAIAAAHTYASLLRHDPKLRANFAYCMCDFYQHREP